MLIAKLPTSSHPRTRMLLLCFIIVIALSFSTLLVTAFAGTRTVIMSHAAIAAEPTNQQSGVVSADSNGLAIQSPHHASSQTVNDADESAFSLAAQPETTLTVQILSPPWATLDSDHPSGGSGQIVPSAFVVEAVVTNTGPTTATRVNVNLDYNESIPGNWLLLNDEDPKRTIEALPSTEAAHLYWFATYSTTIGASHIYTVTADGENTNPVSTSENFYNPSGPTVQTQAVLDTGNSGIVSQTTDILVGVAFTITIDYYDLGQNPEKIALAPAGNPEFNAGAYRLLKTKVQFFDSADTLLEEFEDRVYFPQLPPSTNWAEITYTFVALTPVNTYLCSYGAVGTATTWKYDTDYCGSTQVIDIEGRLSYSMTKGATSLIQQSQNVTYTLDFTNNGDRPLSYAWLWDEINRDHAHILTSTITPKADITSTTLVAWYLNEIPESGQPGSTGTLSFAANVDGNGVDLPDGTQIVNHALFGISPGSLPKEAALTETFTTTVQAPTINISKTDGVPEAKTGDPLTYTIRVTNTGSITATDLIITDTLPAGVNLLTPSPPPDYQDAEKLVWYGTSVGELAPFGDAITITLPVTVSTDLATHSVLTNTASVHYANPAGYVYATQEAQDITTVFRNAGRIVGYAYNDADGDGNFDIVTEEGLSGVTVTLPAALNPVTITNNAGYYSFVIEVTSPPPISVAAAPVDGFFRTTPGTIYTDTHFGITQTVNFGYAPVTSTFGVIYGTVFDDQNHDGVRLGENGIPSVEVSSTGALLSPKTTNKFGYYTFRYDEPGVVTITEENPPYYVSTTPDILQTDVVTGSDNNSPYDFGDFSGIKVEGQVFEDLDVEGDKDPAEPGLAGAYVFSNQDAYTTTSTGYYTLYLTISDSNAITVSEDDPDGYLSTNAIPGPLMSKVDASTLSIDNPISGTIYSGSFGDVLASSVITISGYVWNDNGPGGYFANGQPDPGEPFLAGAVISTTSGMSQITGMDGSFSLYAPPNTTVTLTETNPDGYASTNAIPGNDANKIDNDRIQVDGLPERSTSAGNLFGDVLLNDVALITGTVFYDLDLDGFLDPDEVGFSGVTVTLEISGGNTIEEPTNANGNYQFAVAPGAFVKITSSSPGGSYYPTTLESFFANPGSPGVYPDNNFGYSDVSDRGVIAGIVFDDGNGNGEHNLDEGGLAGAVITLTDSTGVPLDVFTTTGNGLITGTYTFSVPRSITTTFGVHEQNPPGYQSTTPDDVYLQVNPFIPTYFVNFGDRDENLGGVSFFGTVFNDRNFNAVRDSGELGISGVTMTVTSTAGVPFDPYLTNEWGQFTFLLEYTGTYTLTETDPDGYGSTIAIPGDPAVVRVNNNTLRAEIDASHFGLDLGDNLFGDAVAADLAITKQASSGSVAAGSVLTYTLSYQNNGPSNAIEVTITDTLPANVEFGGVFNEDPPMDSFNFDGTYLVWHKDQLTDQVTGTIIFTVTVNPDAVVSVNNQVEIRSSTYDNNLNNNQDTTVTGIGTGDLATIWGFVFEDANCNGLKDAGEDGIANVDITLDGNPSVETDNDGIYVFLTDIPGTHAVVETDPGGYFSTTPNEVHLDVEMGNTYQVDFGEAPSGAQCAAIYGTVFDDLDEDTGWDTEEPGISGVTIQIVDGIATTTNAYGGYTIAMDEDGSKTVEEQNLPGYVSTTPDFVTVDVEFGSGYEVNFGDVLSCTCLGDSYEEDDTWDQAQMLLLGKDNAQSRNFCDDDGDWIAFSADYGDVYTITTDAVGVRADTFLELYDTDGETLLTSTDDYDGETNFSSQIVWVAPQNGIYYIKVTNRAGLVGCQCEYEIWLEKTDNHFLFLPVMMKDAETNVQNQNPFLSENSPQGEIIHVCPDAYEVDDTWWSAFPIGDGIRQTHSFDSNPAQYAADKDFVYVDLKAREVVTFTVVSTINAQTSLELYDSQGIALNVTGTDQIVWEAPTPGRYYLGVFPQSDTFGCPGTVGYDLEAKIFRVTEIYLPFIFR